VSQAELALQTDETPVGCVLVHNKSIVARGMNATNCTLNGTRHAEFIAVNHLISPSFSSLSPSDTQISFQDQMSRLKETDLYVTVEPCIMCASFLRQLGIRKVYFGAVNDRFGGTGGVLNIHNMKYNIEGDIGYEVSGGWLREEAIMVLRRFYVQENEKGRFSLIICFHCYGVVLIFQNEILMQSSAGT